MANRDNYSTEESESDNGEGTRHYKVNAFGEPKTSGHNRPPCCKKLCEKREHVATRKSKWISALHKAKTISQQVSSNILHKFTTESHNYNNNIM